MIIVFIGPPYAGKDTQGKLLSQKFGNIPIFSMGGLIREARERGNETFIKAYEEYSLKGLHLPTLVKFPLLKEKMDKAKDGFILDNFPATADDLKMFNDYLSATNKKINRVIYLYISEEEMKKRFQNAFRGRKDDDPNIVAARKEIQDKDRVPVINYYRSQNQLCEINGEGDINKIHKKILEEILKGENKMIDSKTKSDLVKTKKEIAIMRIGGKVLAEVLEEVIKNVKVGVSELELDKLAEQLILQKGGEPGFKKVDGYKHAICISTNDVVVHGIPTEYRLKEGDVVGIDCGVYYKGFHTDMAQTVKIRNPNIEIRNNEIDRFLETGEKAMWEGIKAAKLGNRIGHISKTIQDVVEGAGYSVVRSLIGHGVGRELHEEPEVPGFLDEPIDKTPKLSIGMTIAIEVIYNMGRSDVAYSNSDGWTIKSKDHSLSGLFERTIAITNKGTIVLTQ